MSRVGNRRNFARSAAIVVALAAMLSFGEAAQAAPLRSGTVLGGWFPFAVFLAPGGPPSCDWNADCFVWRTSGCRAELAGRDPAIFASIVNVRSLAGSSRRRVLRLRQNPAGIMWGGIAVEFWSKLCAPVSPVGNDFRGGSTVRSTTAFRIPRGAVWMTISSVDDTMFDWALY